MITDLHFSYGFHSGISTFLFAGMTEIGPWIKQYLLGYRKTNKAFIFQVEKIIKGNSNKKIYDLKIITSEGK